MSEKQILHGSCSRSKGDLSRLQRTRPRGCVRGSRLSSASEPPNAHRSLKRLAGNHSGTRFIRPRMDGFKQIQHLDTFDG